MKTKFNLINVILYAKNWYIHSDNIIEDLKKCLDADGYMSSTKMDIFNILIRRFKSIDYLTSDKYIKMIIESSPSECWKCGYYTKDNCFYTSDKDNYPDYDYHTAFIYWCLSEISMMGRDECEFGVPSSKILPVKYGNIKLAKEILKTFN